MTKESTQPKKPRHTATDKPDTQPIPWLTATLLFWPVAIAGAALDLWSKWAVFKWLEELPYQQYILIDGYVRFIMQENDGAAFSLFRGMTFMLVGISVTALIIVVSIFFLRKIHSKLMLFALGCITSGIIGNLYDRAFNEGHVRDFIDVLIPAINYPWPTFNVADSMLCIGVGLLIISNFAEGHLWWPAPHQQH
jgi:signal peptidase II